MEPAAKEMTEALNGVEIVPPRVPLVANVTAQPVSDPATIVKLLIQQVTSRVRWRECVETLVSEGADTLIEIGSGKVLTGLNRRINRDIFGVAIQGPADIDTFLSSL
jgi:[acyl-carrier-protein] S-malonyltransferase